MPSITPIASLPTLPFLDDIKALRHDLHRHPELAFAETQTAALVAKELTRYGLAVTTGIGKTGVVGVLTRGSSSRAIALRADMDALPIAEKSALSHASLIPGKMHACGHDGHTAILLGAARYLAESGGFDGKVVFVFQPAEEGEGGAEAMIADGLFDRFPVEGIYALHNWPGIPVGEMTIFEGPVMAGTCRFSIEIVGKGCHAALPHQGKNPILAAAALVPLLQQIVSTRLSPDSQGLLSVTQIHAGDTWNVIPATLSIKGTIRSFSKAVQQQIIHEIKTCCAGVGAASGTTLQISVDEGYPPTLNSEIETQHCQSVASVLLGKDKVDCTRQPAMTAEDFSYFLEKKQGCYAWLGNGMSESLHNPSYDFNDALLPIGIHYWTALVRHLLPISISDNT